MPHPVSPQAVPHRNLTSREISERFHVFLAVLRWSTSGALR